MNQISQGSAPRPDEPHPDLAAAVRRLAHTNVLVIGDVMLDRYTFGEVTRISQEAPVPILAIEREVALPGGAGNVVRNLTALGAATAFISVVGDDQAGSDLTGLIGGQPECGALAAGARRPHHDAENPPDRGRTAVAARRP
jgi:D-beta-D-heptose 7-phosphate kinase/D-beta-D-heptose 1-phosphate adenosyltransferase